MEKKFEEFYKSKYVGEYKSHIDKIKTQVKADLAQNTERSNKGEKLLEYKPGPDFFS